MVSEIFDPSRWEAVPGFDFSDITYHRCVDLGVVRVGFDRPEVGLIVKYNRDGGSANHWTDELGRNWDDFVNFDLPDRDVFEIDADANPPVAVNGSSACSRITP